MATERPGFDTLPLFPDDKEILYIESIQEMLLGIPAQLGEQNLVFDRFQSYAFLHENIQNAALPDIISHMVKTGWEVAATVDFGSTVKESQSVISTMFTLSRIRETDNVEETLEISTQLHPSKGEFWSRMTKLENKVVIEESETKFVDADEIYHFIASIASRGDDSLAANYLEHPGQFRQYLHNPFSFSHVHDTLNKHANGNFRQSTYHLDDPVTTLPADLTLEYIEDVVTKIDVDLWSGKKKKDALVVTVNTESPTIDNQANVQPSGEIDFFFGNEQPEIEAPLYSRPITFETGFGPYQPSLGDLEEIHSRLTDIINFIAPPVEEVPLEEDNDVEDEMDDEIVPAEENAVDESDIE